MSMLTQIENIIKRLDEVLNADEIGKREIRKLGTIRDNLFDLQQRMIQEATPQEPKTIDYAIEWIKAHKAEGTYLALMDAENYLIRTIRISEAILGKMEVRIERTPVTVALKKIELVIPELDLRKQISAKVENFVQITKEGEEVNQL